MVDCIDGYKQILNGYFGSMVAMKQSEIDCGFMYTLNVTFFSLLLQVNLEPP